MPNRRDFIARTVASVTIATSSRITASTGGREGYQAAVHRRTECATLPNIKAVVRRDETTVRYPVSGDNWHMSWAADDRQYAALCDGYGWLKRPKGMLNSKLIAVTGGAGNASFVDVSGYPGLIRRPDETYYYSFGTLALGDRVYQFLSTLNHPATKPDGTPWRDLRFTGVKLIYSPDNGRTWCNQDGSTPVVWEAWQNRSKRTMIFFEEPQEAFSLLSVLQMGRNYEDNQDGYVYVYAPNGNTDGTMNELVMFRVPKRKLLDRQSYEYCAGLRATGGANWTKDIGSRAVVCTFPRGWVTNDVHPWSWLPYVVYNAPLGIYMMASWGTGSGPDKKWFGKASYLGIWTAAHPWGPWKQVHEETAWAPDNDLAARAYSPIIAPKWIAPDGKSFWLVWTDFQVKDAQDYEQFLSEIGTKRKQQTLTEADWLQSAEMMRKHKPYYSFNVQRVDLVVV